MILTFFIVMFILLMHFLWLHIDDILGKGLSLGLILELLMYAMATFIPMALPLATLLASIMTMGNMGEYNELLALKAAGVSLPKIMKPLIILMVFVCGGSFFIINNLTPFAWQQMTTLIYDFKNTKHEMQLHDGIFFNGFDNMSIRVDHQDPKTKKLTNVLIYNNQDRDKMQTIVADSGYLKMSEDRKYIIITLFKGQIYEQNRNWDWYNKNVLSHHIFDHQISYIATSGFAMDRADVDLFKSKSETKNMSQLSQDIDSLRHVQDSVMTKFNNTLIKSYVFKRYSQERSLDSLPERENMYIADRLDTMAIVDRNFVFEAAKQTAVQARDYLKYELEFVRYPSMQLFRAQENFQKKIALPFSIMIFFLIGAPLGAIIRKGGLGMPIVISVSFFVFYYIISITGETMVRDGSMPAFIGMWLSSFILFPIAIFLTYKSANDSALLNSEQYILKLKQLKAFFAKIIKRNDKNS